ncbi:unnamed protein product (macronuclear) [Paramecium tetraurelia]|uniref:Uncharacterized protein n=1 Tax=Paramecium tetraurelia TaxID=5888 RepID=A0DTH4_PARTE|nr:uncharacterized protein GSPATT00020022001 [Paramecium tetraurelia]CAK86341.1 unnamed protein product [Paramecium tetraurelia]|eukprot:XP_001453738.1 hypothetical protein (macronuclear) [Paramecium tetraurelia strain d4-2]
MDSQQQQDQKQPSSIGQAIKQQVLKAWQPVPTLNSTIILFGILSVYFLSMGIVLNVYSGKINQQSFRYDAFCQGYPICDFTIALDTNYTAPVYIYYQLDNFYQNQRRQYITSKSVEQLSGTKGLGVDDLSSCYPVITNAQMNKTVAIDGTPLTPTAPAIPCGLIAQSLFNDTFDISYELNNGTLIKVPVSSQGIAWPTDLEVYQNTDASQQWYNVTDERFIVWMRVAAMPNFRKLWGVINQDLPQGRYSIVITNNYDSSQYGGKKYIVFSTTNQFGGKNEFLSVAYICVGVASSLVQLLDFV